MNSFQMPDGQGPLAPQALPAGLNPPEQGEPADQEDPLDVLQECIQALPKVISSLPDPQDTQDAITALGILAKIQTRMMARNGPTQGR